MMNGPFGDFYRGKTVLVTGHTGFKGGWLATWLVDMGARVVGYSLAPPSEPSLFEGCGLSRRLKHIHGDVRDAALLDRTFAEHQPDVVFHLAAQPIVRESFAQPRLTFDVNLMGTVNVLQAASQTPSVRAVVAITSDKCYQNVEWAWGYRETDALGGPDPYSASKACAELAIACYADPRFQRSAPGAHPVAIASVRAGNVIGGGDWAADRIVPDAIRAIVARRDLMMRNPDAVRPWQHVLEPLSGYLWLGSLIGDDPRYRGAWNFGPVESDPPTVEQVVRGLLDRWPDHNTQIVIQRDPARHEARLLRLDCAKAQQELGWRATWDNARTLDMVAEWYRAFYSGADVHDTCLQQIERYVGDAAGQLIAWCGGGARDGTVAFSV